MLERARTVSITGPGGCGKTRLSVQVAAEVADRYADGVWIVELARLADPELVPTATASVLGAREQPHRTFEQTLVDYLGSKSLLLILDNCEHLLQASAELAEHLLRACPGLRVLTTSRQPLGIPGEVVWRIGPLGLPAAEPATLDEASQCEAVQLFIDRARAVVPTFTLTPENAPTVTQICRRLDGLPLALELAAARLLVLTPQQIVAHLDDLFRLLVGGARTAPPRMHTLRATIDWSYSLLASAERFVFRTMAVFAGGCTLDAAEAICGGIQPNFEVLNVLSALVDKSLCVGAPEADGEMRFDMLETIRQYARTRLVESGGQGQAQRAHATYFQGLAYRALPELFIADQNAWLQRLEREHDNFRAALVWAFEDGDNNIAMNLGASLWRFWRYHGHLAEAAGWLERLLALPSPLSPALMMVLFGAGVIAVRRGAIDQGTGHFERLRDLAAGSHPSMLVGALTQLAHLARGRGDDREAQELYTEALDLSRQHALAWNVAIAQTGLARIAIERGEHTNARRLCDEAFDLASGLPDRMLLSETHITLGLLARAEGRLVEARAEFVTALRLSREMGNIDGQMDCLRLLAGQAVVDAQPLRAIRLLGALAANREAIGFGPLEAASQRDLAAARALVSDGDAKAVWSAGQELSLEQAVETALAQHGPD
jgi:non-specific serine/threonine protein kinase